MELKKWIALVGVALAAGVALMVRGAGPATGPTTQPAAVIGGTMQRKTPGVISGSTTAPVAGGGGSDSRRDRTDHHRDRNRDAAIVKSPGPAADPYAIVQKRSIFVKGNQSINTDGQSGGSSSASGPLAGRKENSLVFNGVIVVDGQANALVQDLGSGNVVNVRAGDAIAGGKVSAISFDDLTYEHNAKILHVEIGQNLEGVTASSDSSASGATTMPTSTPSAGGAIGPAGSTGETSTDDILTRMRARRLKESGGK